MLEQLFGSRTRVKLLRLFLVHSDREWYVRQLTRTISQQINSVRRELNHLERLGLVSAQLRQQKKYYHVNTHFSLYQELKALMIKSRLTQEKTFIHQIAALGRIQYLTLMGYFVDDNQSMIDLFIIGTVAKKPLESLLEEFRRQFGKELRYTLMSPSEYSYRRDVTDKFLYTILNSPQVVVIDRLAVNRT